MESAEGQAVVETMIETNEGAVFDCGDKEMNKIAEEISGLCNEWLQEQLAAVTPEEPEPEEPVEDVRRSLCRAAREDGVSSAEEVRCGARNLAASRRLSMCIFAGCGKRSSAI